MTRLSKDEIEAKLIDHAAGLFAKYGIEHTSLQAIANAMKYSKADLLHRYPNKQAIYNAVLKTLAEFIRTVFDNVEHMPVGSDRQQAVIAAAVDFTFNWPGISALGNRLADSPNIDPELTQIGFIAYAALGIDLTTASQERIIRVTSAFSGMGAIALLAARLGLQQQWRGDIINAAMGALGHDDKKPQKGTKRTAVLKLCFKKTVIKA